MDDIVIIFKSIKVGFSFVLYLILLLVNVHSKQSKLSRSIKIKSTKKLSKYFNNTDKTKKSVLNTNSKLSLHLSIHIRLKLQVSLC